MPSCGKILFAVGILLEELVLDRVDLSCSFVREEVGYLNVSREPTWNRGFKALRW